MLSRHRLRAAIAAAVGAVLAATLAFAPGGSTYSAFSDFANTNGNTASAAVWQPNPPSGCGDLALYADVVYSTVAHATIAANVKAEVVFALGDDATVYAGIGDCVVTGAGAYTIHLDGLASVAGSLGSALALCHGPLALLAALAVGPGICSLVTTVSAVLNLNLGLGGPGASPNTKKHAGTGHGAAATRLGDSTPTTPVAHPAPSATAPATPAAAPTASAAPVTPAASPTARGSQSTPTGDPATPTPGASSSTAGETTP
jgi:hypothetical protein